MYPAALYLTAVNLQMLTPCPKNIYLLIFARQGVFKVTGAEQICFSTFDHPVLSPFSTDFKFERSPLDPI